MKEERWMRKARVAAQKIRDDSKKERAIKIAHIIRIVADEYDLTQEEILSRGTGSHKIKHARVIVMYHCRDLATPREISRIMNERLVVEVNRAIESIEYRSKKHPEFAEKFNNTLPEIEALS